MSGQIYCYDKGILSAKDAEVVAEFPLALHVNGREIATLIASPHDLRFLVAGFLRLQGFVRSVDDFQALSVCSEFGAASVTIKGEIPERLKPILTSGCGSGITFDLSKTGPRLLSRRVYTPDAIFLLMQELSERAFLYHMSGGMHSAGVGGESLILAAEDIGRHNTVDRIAGEALLKGIDLSGTILVTSGRISTELIAKASLLGIEVVASRTAPTDMALKLALKAGITVIGYLRGRRFNVYTHPQRISVPQVAPPLREAQGSVGVHGAPMKREGRDLWARRA